MSHHEIDTEISSSRDDVLVEQAQKVKTLVTQIFDNRYNFGESEITEAPIREQLEAMSREALVMAAWQGITNYHIELTVWGNAPRVQRLEQEKEYRKSLLSAVELKQAINKANNWLDDHFDK